MKKFQGEYTIGLDIGTASVGWSCINKDYELLEFRNRKAIGVNLFNSADTAEARRLKRGMRRRYNRRIKRIQMLQELFQPLINDQDFFSNLSTDHKWKNSNNFENRTLSETLIELGFSKEEIHTKFPTIYHLRDFLISTNEEQDIKLIYLAIHNLVKFRGHFLLNIDSWEDRDSSEEKEGLLEFLENLYEINKIDETVSEKIVESISEILGDTRTTGNDKSKAVQKHLPKDLKDIGKLLTGLKSNLHNVFYNCENNDEIKESKIAIKLSNDDEDIDLSVLTDDQLEIIEQAKKLYLDMTLKEVLKDFDYVSRAKVSEFNKNKRQLKILKSLIKDNYDTQTYKNFFVTPKSVFAEYYNKPDVKNLAKLSYFDQYRLNKNKGKDKFISEIKKVLKNNLEDEKSDNNRISILEQVENELFLPFLNNVSNSSVPHQNSLYEAKKILLNQQKYHKDISQNLVDKVAQLISFRIPYYIGPLVKNDGDSEFAWSSRIKDTNITPFNFDEVIDKSTSAAEFINRMTNKCSYLLQEDVLPKHSLLYQEMEVRNELNGINLRSESQISDKVHRLPQDVKNNVFENHFKNTKKVTHKNLKEFLKKSVDGYEDKEVFGTQKENEFASSLSSYIDFRNILGKEKLESHLDEVEHIISWVTIFNEKSIIREKIQDNFDFIESDELEKILKLNYSGWGRLSKKALTLVNNDESIISLMRTDDYNFMEAYTSPRYGFKEVYEDINKKFKGIKNKIEYSDIAELKCSPALKKSIWSTVKIVDELVSIFGEPKNIVIEFAREEGEKKRTVEWKKQWDVLIKDNDLMKKDEFSEMFKDVSNYRGDLDYKLEKLKLYLLQGGKCLYTLEKINLQALIMDSSKPAGQRYYEVDHILPRNFVKDDSLNNKVLVIKEANQRKSGYKMPLSIAGDKKLKLIRYWRLLADNNMMSASKLHKLMKEEFSDVDKERFIARQLVETRQITVHVKNLLEERFASTDDNKVSIDILKAGIVSEVRKKLDFPKIRELNDYHHAIDALLIAGIHQFGEEIKPNLFKFDLRKHKAKEKWRKLNEEESNKFNPELFLITEMRKSELRNDRTFEFIFENLIKNSHPLVTKKVENSESAFYKESILSPKVKVPKYTSSKNGKFVHDEVKKAYSIFISYFIKNKKGELIKKHRLIDVTNIDAAQNEFENANSLAEFYASKLENVSSIEQARLLLKLNKGDLIYINKEPFYFMSSGELNNAKQLNISFELQRNLKKQLNKWAFEKDEALKIYEQLASEVINQFSHILPATQEKYEKKTQEILGYFSNTSLSHEDFVSSVNELLKVSSPSAARSEKLGGRPSASANKTIQDGSYSSSSITGLKYKKPKRLIKFLED